VTALSTSHLAAVLALAALAGEAPPPTAADPRTEIVGTWRGTSTCVRFPGNEACNDEVVRYEFRASDRPGMVRQTAYKMVGGKPEPMGELDGFTRDAAGGRWSAEFRNARVHIIWSYSVRADTLTGTCTDFRDPRVVFRNVEARRDAR
jgi:hypothetical protein